MRKPSDKAVSTIAAIAIGLFITLVIAAGTYIAHHGAVMSNYNMQGMTPGHPKPVQQPFPTKPWK